MKREILFRGKRLDNSEWAYGVPVSDENIVRIAEIKSIDEITEFLVDPETIGQYTGLTDKNGTKIFEGDILKNHEGDTGIVQWFPEHSAFMIFCTNQNKIYFLYDNDFSKIEVIGNVFDNPELIK